MATDTDIAVAAHYAAYPYPARNPADEAKRLIEGSPSRLAEIEHYLFDGRLPEPFRALVAGGGSGDATIMLAQHMADRKLAGEVVWLDLSPAARAVAEARAAARGLTNVRFVEGSLLDAEAAVGGGFDYVDCCGVLHHLAAPEAGLAALRAVLKATGGLGVMVYGAIGRRGVYDMQALGDVLAPQSLPPAERLAVGRRLFADLPPSHWLKRNPFVRDHLDGGDAGFYDLLLHARDRAYTVPEFGALATSAGLEIVSFIEPALYDPAAYLRDPKLKAKAAALPPLAQAAMAEQIAGMLTKHVAYLAPDARRPAAPDDPGLIPILRDGDGPALAGALRSGRIVAKHMGVEIAIPVPKLAPAMVRRIDGERTLGAIAEDLRQADAALNWPKFQAAFQDTFQALHRLNLIWLRRP